MNVNLTLNQADAYAQIYETAWRFIIACRKACGVTTPGPVSFDEGDALDILNGYGYGMMTSSQIIVENPRTCGDVFVTYGPDQDLPGEYFGDRVHLSHCLRTLNLRRWMLIFAHKDGENYNLKQAYAYRKQFLQHCNAYWDYS